MRYYSELKQAILDKLGQTEEEALESGVLDKLRHLCNEALTFIANDLKPNIKDVDVVTEEDNTLVVLPYDFISMSEHNPITKYKKKVIDEKATSVIDMYKYIDVYITNPDIKYHGKGKYLIPKKGEYKIFYNATYPLIEKEDAETSVDGDETNLIDKGIPMSVLMTLPSYVASQLKLQEDITLATVLRNEFELMVSRLNNDEYFNYYEIIDYYGGWYE